MLAILLALIVLIIAFGAGSRLLHWMKLFLAPDTSRTKPPPLFEEFIFATALGLGALSYLILLLGLFKFLYVWSIGGLLLILAVLGWKEIHRLLGGISLGFKKSLKTVFSYSAVALGLWSVGMTLFLLVGVLAPSSGSGWDGLAYHLAVPKIYLQQHSISAIPWMSHSNFPFAMEMLYVLGLALHGQMLAKLLNFCCGLLIALTIYCWGSKSIGKGAGLLGMAIFISIPIVFWEATVAYNELAFTLFCLLSIWAWWRKDEVPGSRWIILSGIFAGLALATKMLAGFLVIFMLIAILWRKAVQPANAQHPKQKTKADSKSISGKANTPAANPTTGTSRPVALLLWLLPAILVAAPWYIKSYLWTGNPVYPFFYEVFGGHYWSQALASQYATAQAKFGMGHGIGWLFALPWTLTMYGYRFYDQPEALKTFNVLFTVIGPLFLALLPVMIIRAWRDSLTRFFLAFCGAAIISWFLLSAQTNRYLLPILPVLSMAAAGAIIQMQKWSHRLGVVVATALGIELTLGMAVCLLLIGQQAPPVFNLESDKEYLTRTLNIYPICEQVNSQLPEDAKIMLLHDTRGFYLDREYIWGIGHHNLIQSRETASPETLFAALQRLGVTHLLISPDVRRSITSSDDPLQKSLRSLIDDGSLNQVLDDSKGGFIVFALNTE